MSICSRCGAEFGCAMADGTPGACWCTELPPLVPLPELGSGCWCPACLRAHMADMAPAPPPKPQEPQEA